MNQLNIDWASPQIRSKIRTWKNIESDSDEVNAYNFYDSIGTINTLSRRKQSLIYLADAEKNRKRNMFKYRTMIIISGVRGENFDKSIFMIQDYCKRTGIVITRVEII